MFFADEDQVLPFLACSPSCAVHLGSHRRDIETGGCSRICCCVYLSEGLSSVCCV